MVIANFISYLIFIYLLVYSIYFLTLTIKSFGSKKYIEEQCDQLAATSANNKLCVIIWASDKNKNLFGLLDSLNNQTYSKENYDVNVIYKNSALSKTQIPDFAHGARIHSIENPEFFSKNKAITTFIERIITDNKYDAFVFIGADRLIGSNYLEVINRKVAPGSVLVGSLSIVADNEKTFIRKFFARALQAKAELTNNSVNISRAMFELCQTIDGDNCVISGDVIERIGMVCFESKNDELKYSLFLASNDIKPIYYHLIATGIEASNFNAGAPSFKQAFSLLKHYLKTIHKKSWYFVEYMTSVFRPTTLFLLTSYFVLFYLSFSFSSTIVTKYVVHLGLFLILLMGVSIIAARISPIKAFYLLFSPIPLFVAKFIRITNKISKKSIKKQYEEERNVDSATINSFVTNGKKSVACKLDLVSEEGMRKVVFRYKKKRFESGEHLRMCDAFNDITKSLEEKGYILKVCQNCVHYSIDNDATVDQLKGYCGVGVGAQIQDENGSQILIWNCCGNFLARNHNAVKE